METSSLAPERPLADGSTAAAILSALGRYRRAERDMRRRISARVGLSEGDLVALRLLTEARSDGALLSASDLAKQMGISSASVTALVDRLEQAGCLRRTAHHHDRRVVLLEPTIDGRTDVEAALGNDLAAVSGAVGSIDPESTDCILDFLDSLTAALDGVDAEAGA